MSTEAKTPANPKEAKAVVVDINGKTYFGMVPTLPRIVALQHQTRQILEDAGDEQVWGLLTTCSAVIGLAIADSLDVQWTGNVTQFGEAAYEAIAERTGMGEGTNEAIISEGKRLFTLYAERAKAFSSMVDAAAVPTEATPS